MKKVLLFIVAIVITTVTFAQPFVPNTLLLNPNHPPRETILFNWQSEGVVIPVEIQGGAATTVLMIYTSGKGEEIGFVHNGYRGWHRVNKIDTAIYIAPPVELPPGDNPAALFWDFKDQDGNKTEFDAEFNYYLFAYEHNTPKATVINRGTPGSGWGNRHHFNIMGEGGEALDSPVLFNGGNRRWALGGDPADPSNMKTTSQNPVAVAVDKHDDNYFYGTYNHADTHSMHVRRYQFVENGVSILDETWGIGDGETLGFTPIWEGIWGAYGSGHRSHAGVVSDLDYLYVAGNTRESTYYFFHTLDYDGEIVDIQDMSDLYVEDPNPPPGFGLFPVGGGDQIKIFDEFSSAKVILNAHNYCWIVVVDPIRGIENADDFLVWVNGNGDYFIDTFTPEVQPDPIAQWRCNTVDSAPYTYGTSSGADGIGIIHTYGIGMPTFGLYGPDGTGAGYYALYGESGDRLKRGTVFLNYGRQWDGIYSDANSTHPPDEGNDVTGVWYTPANTFAGKLVHNADNVEEKAPVGFSVAQNTPNPFNPTTDISFTIPARDLVTVDIYNIAGQKIQTLMNEILDSGTHRITWDASAFAGGVYFYTVTSGNFSRTMKMTLVK